MDATPNVTDAVQLPPPAAAAIAPTPAHAEGLGGGRSATPAPRSSPRGPIGASIAQALRQSVWARVAGKASAVGAGMLGLAAIGAWSTLAGAGVPVNAAGPRASADAHGAWVAPAHPAASGAESATASAPPALLVSGPANTPGANGSSQPPVTPPAAATVASGKSAGITADGKVVLNAATVDDLLKLPRVGPKRAQAIVDLRARLGKFRKPTDLLRVRGIGRKTLILMLPKLVVDAPADTAK